MTKLKNISKKILLKAVSKSYYFNELMGKLNYKNRTSGYLNLKKIIKNYGIDTSHFKSISRKNNFKEWLVLG